MVLIDLAVRRLQLPQGSPIGVEGGPLLGFFNVPLVPSTPRSISPRSHCENRDEILYG